MDDDAYNQKRENKEKEYNKLCAENNGFFFISTIEDDVYNLKERLGKKLNDTPLRKPTWK